MQTLETHLRDEHGVGRMEFRRYYYGWKSLAWEHRKELIDQFGWSNEERLTICLLHKLYQNEEDRAYMLEKLMAHKWGASKLLPLFRDNLLSAEERKRAVEKIKNRGDKTVHTWFLDEYYGATEEEKAAILGIAPEERSHHGCYMFLLHGNEKLVQGNRERAFESMLQRGILYYLDLIRTAPHTIHPAWVPSEAHKTRVKERIEELRAGSKEAFGQYVDRDRATLQAYREKIGDSDSMYQNLYQVRANGKTYCYPTGWTPRGGGYGSVRVRIKDGFIIEAANSH